MRAAELKEYLSRLPRHQFLEMERRSTDPFELELLHRLVLQTRIDLRGVGEVGTWRGLSALWLASAASIRGRGFVTIDVDPQATISAQSHFDQSGLSRELRAGSIMAHCGDSIQLLRSAASWCNFWFVDGCHSYEVVMEETRIIRGFGHEDLVVIYDDAFDLHADGAKDGGVPRAMKELEAEPVPATSRMAYIHRGRRPW